MKHSPFDELFALRPHFTLSANKYNPLCLANCASKYIPFPAAKFRCTLGFQKS
jgi:hypothetical protein